MLYAPEVRLSSFLLNPSHLESSRAYAIPCPCRCPSLPPPSSITMALKRKLSAEFDDVPRTVSHIACAYTRVTRLTSALQNGKQAKLVPFPNSSDLDSDVAMSDASMSDLEPLAIPAHPYHIRLPSNASYASSASSDSPRNSRK